MLEDVAAAVDAGPLAVPHAEHAVVARAVEQVHLLAAPHRRGGEVELRLILLERVVPENPEDEKDPSYFELRLETDELTQLTYLKVSDYSEFDDQEELQDLWDGLVDNLKTVVGG